MHAAGAALAVVPEHAVPANVVALVLSAGVGIPALVVSVLYIVNPEYCGRILRSVRRFGASIVGTLSDIEDELPASPLDAEDRDDEADVALSPIGRARTRLVRRYSITLRPGTIDGVCIRGSAI